jgi:hypothetical protein
MPVVDGRAALKERHVPVVCDGVSDGGSTIHCELVCRQGKLGLLGLAQEVLVFAPKVRTVNEDSAKLTKAALPGGRP